MKLPELPKPQWLGDIHGYTEAQMLALRATTVEACAKVCESEACSCCWTEDATEMAAHLTDAIRGME